MNDKFSNIMKQTLKSRVDRTAMIRTENNSPINSKVREDLQQILSNKA